MSYAKLNLLSHNNYSHIVSHTVINSINYRMYHHNNIQGGKGYIEKTWQVASEKK